MKEFTWYWYEEYIKYAGFQQDISHFDIILDYIILLPFIIILIFLLIPINKKNKRKK